MVLDILNNKPYNDLSDSDKAHVDAYNDHLDTLAVEAKYDGNPPCICGTFNCPDAYEHTTGGA